MRLLENPSLSSLGFTKASEADEDQTPTRKRAPPRIFWSKGLIIAGNSPWLLTKGEPSDVLTTVLDLSEPGATSLP